MNEFNEILPFKEDLINALTTLIESKLKDSIEYMIDTHNIKPLLEIIEVLKANSYYTQLTK